MKQSVATATVTAFLSLTSAVTSSSSAILSIQAQSQRQQRRQEQDSHGRVLERIADYEPETSVRGQSALDLDIDEMKTQLSFGDTTGFFSAMVVYARGGHSRPVAEIEVLNSGGLPTPMAKGDKVIGWNAAKNREVIAFAADTFPVGSTTIRLNYDTTGTNGSSSIDWCQVGGMPVPFLDNCLAESGDLVVSGLGKLIYSYDLFKNNVNDESVQRYSTKARDEMYLCENCPYQDFQKFYNYYGVWDYADQFIMAAKSGTQTSEFERGAVNFSGMDIVGRGQAILSASVYLSIFMRVIRQMERALDDCKLGLEVDSTSGLISWDSAVALYTGSLEGPTGAGDGVLLYNLADERCMDFRTCGLTEDDATTGRSYINVHIFLEFRDGQRKLRQGDCKGPRSNKERIVQLMTVPLIQSTILYAWKQSYGGDANEATEATGATLAAAIQPFIHDCGNTGPADAEIIHTNMKVDHDATDFEAVKLALERNYQCLNISCADVGGYWDSDSQNFVEGAGPCQQTRHGDSESSGINVGLAVGLAVGGLVLLLLVVCVCSHCSEKSFSLKPGSPDYKDNVPEII